MKHNINSFEFEIIQQILICEICFETCQSIPGFPGLGNHFLPYFYNLNYQKGISSLNSMLLSNESNELSIKNYIKLNKKNNSKKNIKGFERDLEKISKDFKDISWFSIRNKVGSHLDGNFKHSDFTTGYLLPNTLNGLIIITKQLKKIFFQFANYSLRDNPNNQLLLQIHKVIDEFTIKEAKKLIKNNII